MRPRIGFIFATSLLFLYLTSPSNASPEKHSLLLPLLDPFKCRMLSEDCSLGLLVRNDINLINLTFQSSSLNFSPTNQSSPALPTTRTAQAGVIVTSPRRIIDSVFDIYVWLLSIGLSFMGVIVDREAFLKIIKMPKTIAIGFACQYLLIPIVNI